MLKFFRLYNKYILVVGGTILMIAFLIEPALSIFQPQQASQPVGTLDGRTVTYGEQTSAAMELHLLGQIPMLGQFAGDDPIKWLLMVHEAGQMGISASNMEVQSLAQTLGIDAAVKARLLQQMRASEAFIDQTLRHWLIVQKYRELLLAQVHVPTLDRISTLATAQQFFQQGNIYGGAAMLGMAYGSPRISEPLIRQFLYNQYATVSGETVLISHERYLDQVEPPSAAEVQALFEAHRDALPGTSEPYGFGYRTPARIKIESLSIALDQVMPQVTLDEADRQDFYDQNRQRFTPTQGGEPRPYAEVRNQISQQLRRQRADQLAQEMIRTARNILLEHEATRRAPESGGYRDLPADFQPMPLEQVAQVIADRYGAKPRIDRHTDRWLSVADVDQLPVVGDSFLAGRQEVSIGQYLMSAREFEPQADNPLLPLRLQVGLPSAPLQSWDGAYALVRLTDAATARSPESLDEVRQQVEQDARKLAAYRLLIADRERWVTQAQQQGLTSFATEVGAAMLNVPPTPRGSSLSTAGQAGGPTIAGIGPAADLLAAMFETGQSLIEAATTVDAAPAAQRTGAANLDAQLSVAVYRVDGFKPMSRGDYEAIASDPRIGSAVAQSLEVHDHEDDPGHDHDPLALDAIAARVGFVAEREAQ